MSFINGCGGIKGKLQTMVIVPSNEQKTIAADQGYDAISEASIEAISSQSKIVYSNGTIEPDDGFNCLSRVTTKVSKSFKTVNVTIAEANETSTPPYYLKFSIPTSAFDNEYTTLPSTIIIAGTSQEFGINLLFLNKSGNDDAYSGQVSFINSNGGTVGDGLAHGIKVYWTVDPSSCLTINNDMYNFYLITSFASSTQEGFAKIFISSTYDVTFIWN